MATLAPDEVWFLGDIIGYYYGAQEILRDMQARGFKMVLGNHDQNFLDMLAGQKDIDVLCSQYGQSYRIARDNFSDEDIAFLADTPKEIGAEINGCRLWAMHGAPWNLLEGRAYPDTTLKRFAPWANRADVLFLGHTHHQMDIKAKKMQIINPGSLGQQRDGLGCSYLIYDTVKRNFSRHVVSFAQNVLAAEIRCKDPGKEKFIEVLYR